MIDTYAIVEGSEAYEVEFEYDNGEISKLTCSCFCSYNCKHEVAAMLQLRETLKVIEKNYAEEYENSGYFAAVTKGTLFAFAIDGKENGSFTLWVDLLQRVEEQLAAMEVFAMTRKKIHSTLGFFGTTVHRDSSGRVVGKSVPGLFGTTVHRDSNGRVVGKSVPGLFGTTVHRDVQGRVVGKSRPGAWGTTVHRGRSGAIGRTTPGLFGSKISRFDSKD